MKYLLGGLINLSSSASSEQECLVYDAWFMEKWCSSFKEFILWIQSLEKYNHKKIPLISHSKVWAWDECDLKQWTHPRCDAFRAFFNTHLAHNVHIAQAGRGFAVYLKLEEAWRKMLERCKSCPRVAPGFFFQSSIYVRLNVIEFRLGRSVHGIQYTI